MMKQLVMTLLVVFFVADGFAQPDVDPVTRDFIERQTLKNIYL